MTDPGGVGFDEFFATATGNLPYAYQAALAADGLPDVLQVPTGAGKTAIALCWLHRALRDHDPDIRRLIFVLPLRTLVEQTETAVRGWVDRLGLAERVRVRVMMGGQAPDDQVWQTRPRDLEIVIGTVDMVLSRALNRGFASSRAMYPMDFGLLSAGSHFVFDEVQLLGPALPTSRQLQGLRDRLGTASPTRSTWMSATVDETAFSTYDNNAIGSRLGLSDADRAGPLGRRLAGERIFEESPPTSGPWPRRSFSSTDRALSHWSSATPWHGRAPCTPP